MICQFLLFVFLVASYAYGEALTEDIKSKYGDCFEIIQCITDLPVDFPLDSLVMDNLCMDSDGLTYHFLSSAQGGTVVFLSIPKSEMTCVFLDSKLIGLKVASSPRVDSNVLISFKENAQAMHIYNDIYRTRNLIRMNFTIDRVQLLLVGQIGSRIMYNSELTKQAGLYAELYRGKRKVFTVKGEDANGDVGDPAVVFMSRGFNLSCVHANNTVVLRSHRNFLCYYILYFSDELEANHFCESLREYVDQKIPVSIPSPVRKILDETQK